MEKDNGVTVNVFELGHGGKLIPLVLNEEFNNLEIGQVIEWGGNMGWPAEKFAIYKTGELGNYGEGRRYHLISMDKPAHILQTNARELKKDGDPGLWHSQHLFILDEKRNPAEVIRLGKDAELIREENLKNAEKARTQFEEEQKTINVGDIFYTSWGYDMTINEFIKIVRFSPSGKSAICQSMTLKTEGDPGRQEPVEAAGPEFKMKILDYNGKKYLRGTYKGIDGERGRLDSFNRWDGKPKYYNTWD